MAKTEAEKRADGKYKKEKTKLKGIRFYPTDMYMLDYINAKENTQDYVKSLIKADMIANGVQIPKED